MLTEHEIQVRVRYEEADPMGFLHHSQYYTYFEMGRTELLRASGGNYRRMEESGLFVVVVKSECVYRQPARYDDLLTIRTEIKRVGGVKIEHEYHVLRDGESVAVGKITLAVVDAAGEVQRVPDFLRGEEAA